MNSNKTLEFNKLKRLIKKLNQQELSDIKREIDDEMKKKQFNNEKKLKLQELLKDGPVFTDNQIQKVYEARKSINQWRNQ